MFTKNDKVETDWLAGVAMFSGFDQEQLMQVAQLGERLEAAAGAELTDQGRYGGTCYAIVEGSANVYMNGQFVASVGAGSMIGEMALLEHRPRSATVVAETDLLLVAFDVKAFGELLDANPTAKERLNNLLTERISDNQARKDQ